MASKHAACTSGDFLSLQVTQSCPDCSSFLCDFYTTSADTTSCPTINIINAFVQMTSSRVRLGQSFKTVGCGCTSCWGDLGAGSVEADVFYIPFIVSVQYIV